ncbi:hypothetical protein HanOQP8_Chr10g0377911 [Helianthus annuus]|nr:hypothetical protein HanLR1_Chr10g0374581 [Helianthus annuus]KAJ0701303.1 hypothetical protein HanOQP8_Chr10g0377911 [Helianthus annuus]
MHPPSSSSSSSNDSSDHNNKIAIIGLPLSTLHTSSLSFFKPTNHFQKLVTESSTTLICNIQNSIDKCFTSLHLFASQNPLFTKLQSLCNEYHNFCQFIVLLVECVPVEIRVLFLLFFMSLNGNTVLPIVALVDDGNVLTLMPRLV